MQTQSFCWLDIATSKAPPEHAKHDSIMGMLHALVACSGDSEINQREDFFLVQTKTHRSWRPGYSSSNFQLLIYVLHWHRLCSFPGNDSFECIPSCIWGKKILKTRLEFLLVLLVVLIDVYVLIPRAWGTEAPQDNVTWVCPLLVTGMRHCVILHQSITNIMLLTNELPLVKDDIVNRADDLAQEEIAPDPSDSWKLRWTAPSTDQSPWICQLSATATDTQTCRNPSPERCSGQTRLWDANAVERFKICRVCS